MDEHKQQSEIQTRPKLTVITPLGNEEATVDDFIERVLKQLDKGDRIFCVLDNVCQDRTREKVKAWSGLDSRVNLVWAPENRCVVDAYFRGYREALNSDCQWFLEMDGGFSHCPEEIPQFIETMQSGVDFAAGSRFVKGGKFTGSISRKCISRGGTFLSNWLLGTKMHDMTSGFECFSRAALEEVVDRGVQSRAHFFQTEIRYMMHRRNWREVPITYKNPSKSVGKANIKEAFRILWQLHKESKLKPTPASEVRS